MESYLPKEGGKPPKPIPVADRIRQLLTPQPESEALMLQRQRDMDSRRDKERAGDKSVSQNKMTPLFACKETRLRCEFWEVDGQMPKGAHYPLYVSTAFESARSPEARANRSRKKHERRKKRDEAAAA